MSETGTGTETVTRTGNENGTETRLPCLMMTFSGAFVLLSSMLEFAV